MQFQSEHDYSLYPVQLECTAGTVLLQKKLNLQAEHLLGPICLPIIHGLGEPAQDGVPVREVGLLLRHILLAVGEHVNEYAYKESCLLFQHLVIQGAQVNQVA